VDAARRINDDAMLADGRWRLTSSKPSAKPVEGIFTAIFVRNAKVATHVSAQQHPERRSYARNRGRPTSPNPSVKARQHAQLS